MFFYKNVFFLFSTYEEINNIRRVQTENVYSPLSFTFRVHTKRDSETTIRRTRSRTLSEVTAKKTPTMTVELVARNSQLHFESGTRVKRRQRYKTVSIIIFLYAL